MPNWCNNHIEIIGPKHKVDALIKGAKEGEFLNTLYPMPQQFKDTEKTSDDEVMAKQPVIDGHNNWYDWRVDNWSTKWDVDLYDPDNLDEQEELFGKDDGDKRVAFGFDSAWSPPIGACEQYLIDNNDMSIRLTYYEPGCDFMGIWEDFDDRCYQCSVDAPTSDSEFWQTEDGKHIDEYMGVVESMIQYEEDQQEEVACGV